MQDKTHSTRLLLLYNKYQPEQTNWKVVVAGATCPALSLSLPFSHFSIVPYVRRTPLQCRTPLSARLFNRFNIKRVHTNTKWSDATAPGVVDSFSSINKRQRAAICSITKFSGTDIVKTCLPPCSCSFSLSFFLIAIPYLFFYNTYDLVFHLVLVLFFFFFFFFFSSLLRQRLLVFSSEWRHLQQSAVSRLAIVSERKKVAQSRCVPSFSFPFSSSLPTCECLCVIVQQ